MPQVIDDTSGQDLVTLSDAKEILGIPVDDTTYDEKVQRYIAAVRPLVEQVTGPIIIATFEEWHDGGQAAIRLRRRPSSGYGTSPVFRLLAVEEFRGPQKYELSIVG